MAEKPDYTVINATIDAIAPIIKANGQTHKAIGHFVYCLLVICATIADELGMTADHFRALAMSAFTAGKTAVKPRSSN